MSDNGHKTRQMRRSDMEQAIGRLTQVVESGYGVTNAEGHVVSQPSLLLQTRALDVAFTRLIDLLELKGFIRREELGLKPKDEPRIVMARPR